jgi:hypothetical protein
MTGKAAAQKFDSDKYIEQMAELAGKSPQKAFRF